MLTAADREKEFQREVNEILGFDAQEAIEAMIDGLQHGILAVPHITEEQKTEMRKLRVRYGWSVEQAFETLIGNKK